MKDAKIVQYKDGARLLFVSQDDYRECSAIIREETSLSIIFWGVNKFVTDRSDYPWYLYIESTDTDDLLFLRGLIAKYQRNTLPEVNSSHDKDRLASVVSTTLVQRELIAIENETIFQAVNEVRADLDKFDDLLVCQFGAISEQISILNSLSSSEINGRFSEIKQSLEFSLKNYLSETLIPLMGNISGANEKASEILDGIKDKERFIQIQQECIRLKDKVHKLENEVEQSKKYAELYEADVILKKTELEEKINNLSSKLSEYEADDNSSSKYAVKILNQLEKDNENISPLVCLRHIQNIHPGKVIVLESAIESAKKVPHFQNGLTLLLSLNKLVDKWFSGFITGGENSVKGIFTKNQYAANESESTLKNHHKTREIDYFGKKVSIARHLKIGVRHDTGQTIRVHFYPDTVRNQIVIAHCGEHLPT